MGFGSEEVFDLDWLVSPLLLGLVQAACVCTAQRSTVSVFDTQEAAVEEVMLRCNPALTRKCTRGSTLFGYAVYTGKCAHKWGFSTQNLHIYIYNGSMDGLLEKRVDSQWSLRSELKLHKLSYNVSLELEEHVRSSLVHAKETILKKQKWSNQNRLKMLSRLNMRCFKSSVVGV